MVQRNGTEGSANLQWWAEPGTPDEKPSWDCNTEEGQGHLEPPGGYFTRPQGGAQKPMSMAKPSKVIQRGNESPSEFYERLCEACILYTSIDPEAVGSQMVINAAFVFQAYPENVRWGDIK